MPVGIQRLNAKKSQPNDRIIFIKPLPGKDEAISQAFLERISAQCLPIMKEHHLSVMTLEEFPPNREFVGRNFNAGEVIQLVLRSRSRSSEWLPFSYVQMVMMHELAHCKQMNHSRAFWAVRNQYAEQMRALWGRGYTGEGIWGRGASLATGGFATRRVADLAAREEQNCLPEHLCGGTYRSRNRRRKRKQQPQKQQLSYQEQKDKRILKKFGKGGVAIGDDEVQKMRLEGKFIGPKPRVAASKRGRDLRAAAALARFANKEEAGKDEKRDGNGDGDGGDGSEIESESDYEDADAGAEDAVDVITGDKILDGKGHRMIKICEDEDPDDQDAMRELLELRSSSMGLGDPAMSMSGGAATAAASAAAAVGNFTAEPKRSSSPEPKRTRTLKMESEDHEPKPTSAAATTTAAAENQDQDQDTSARPCPVCSFGNDDAISVTCGMCAHVLHPENALDAWKCQSEACKGGLYVNSGDCGVCGLCGQRRT